MSNRCDLGALLVKNYLADRTFRFHQDGEDFDDDLPLDVVTLVGCGVATAWGTAVHAGAVPLGDTTIVYEP
jgi:alcohol dehydrogenase (nicotinoprotein)